ncbi:autophagocytosis associated [Cystoisospora suis]|uniref:Autophagocytosis associated n=1 Tax=Cystoisospora suis TaxID=483139 RepID=A0A2C6KRD6_9APIC|nr:autophagocytosis associated [Cystoisospora suis]
MASKQPGDNSSMSNSTCSSVSSGAAGGGGGVCTPQDSTGGDSKTNTKQSTASSATRSFRRGVSSGLSSLSSLSGSNVTHRLADMGRSFVASFTSAPVDSSFIEKGTLTPQEFVDAGDLLNHKFPTWQWQGTSSSDRRPPPCSWLPSDKQYLITRNVPCYRRVRDIDQALNSRAGVDVEGDWMLPLLDEEEEEGRSPPPGSSHDETPELLAEGLRQVHISRRGEDAERDDKRPTSPHHEKARQKSSPSSSARKLQYPASSSKGNPRDDVPDLMSFTDIDDLVQDEEEEEDLAAAEPSYFIRNEPDSGKFKPVVSPGMRMPRHQEKKLPRVDCSEGVAITMHVLVRLLESLTRHGRINLEELQQIVAARTYDLSITYDKYFQTPRIWLFGYSENGVPLTPEEIFEDILTDYVAKTVTVDPHPCTGIPTASIHPCRHASVMKKVVGSWLERGIKPRHDLALLVLLKFISSVIPTIEYDFTMDIDMFMHSSSSSSNSSGSSEKK